MHDLLPCVINTACRTDRVLETSLLALARCCEA